MLANMAITRLSTMAASRKPTLRLVLTLAVRTRTGDAELPDHGAVSALCQYLRSTVVERPSMARRLLSVLLTLTFGLAAVSVADARDRIKVPSKGTITPEGWASVTFRYTCDPRPGLTYLDVSVVQLFGPNGEFSISSFDDVSDPPLVCDKRRHPQTYGEIGADVSNYPPEEPQSRFIPGRAEVCATLWNTESGFFRETRTCRTVKLR
jgi:hypothetical protein